MTQEQKQNFFERLGITPGPWEYISANGSEGGIYQREENGYIGDIYFYHHKNRCQEKDNNGRLISLSPEMFLALVGEWFYLERLLAFVADILPLGVYAEIMERQSFLVVQIQNASGKQWREVREIYEEAIK